MAKITRQRHKIFGASGSTNNFAEFGSLVATTPLKTKDIATIQSLPAWDEGWQSSIFGANKDLLLEDLNSFSYEHSTQVAYLFQAGVAEWEVATEYSIGSLVQRTSGSDATGNIYMSLINANVGNALPTGTSNANWLWINPPFYVVGTNATPGTIPKVESLGPTNGLPGSVTLKNSAIIDDNVNVGISLPLKFPDNTIQATAAAPITAQNVVTGFRALGIVYQNLAGKPMFVTVSVSAGGANFSAFTDGNPAPTTLVATDGAPAPGSNSCLTFIVLPGNYYKVTGAVTLACWTEWS